MSEQSWPFEYDYDDPGVSVDQWSRMARVWAGNGIIGVWGDQEAEVYADSGGLNVRVRPGQAQVQGFHWLLEDDTSLTIGANTSGDPRIDRVVLRAEPSLQEVALAVVEGTPAATPAPPDVTQTDTGVFELALAQVLVGHGVALISADKVTSERTFVRQPPPVGIGYDWYGPTVPAGFTALDGGVLNRVECPRLFAAWGTTFGAGDGSTTFGKPDLRRRVAVGLDGSVTAFNAVGKTGGAQTVTLSEGQLPSHAHSINHGHGNTGTAGNHSHSGTAASNNVPARASNTGGVGGGLQAVHNGTDGGDQDITIRNSSHTHSLSINSAGNHSHSTQPHSGNSGDTGAGQPHENMPPFIVVNKIVELG